MEVRLLLLFFPFLLFGKGAFATEISAASLRSVMSSPALVSIFKTTPDNPSAGRLYFYFASWCEYCKVEVEHLKGLKADIGKNISIVGVSGDEKEKDAQGVLQSWPQNFSLYWDSKEEFKNALQVDKIPFVVVVSADGKIILTHASTSHFKEFLVSVKNILVENRSQALR